MQLIKFVFLIFTITNFSFGQISFYNTYSNGGYDSGEGIIQLADSSYIITGSSSSFTDNNQAFLMQIDSMGNRLWSNHYGGLEADKGRRLFHVPNDGIYVAGQSNSFGNFYDVYFFKTDNQGNLIYEKNYGTSAYENIFDAVMLKDTSFILVGETYFTSNETENIYLLRINKFGDTLWTKNFGSEQKDVARGIKLLNDTTVVIAGEYYVNDSLTQKALLIKMHINGTIEWLKTYGSLGKYGLNDLSIENGEIRAGGNSQSPNFNSGNICAMNMKFDFNGIINFEYSIELTGDFSIEHLTQFGANIDDYYYSFKMDNSPDIPTYNNGPDLSVYKAHSNMFFYPISFNLSNHYDDISNELIPTSDGGAILVGSNQFPSIGGQNILVAKIGINDYFPHLNSVTINSSLAKIEEDLIDKNTIYPNPTSQVLSFNYEIKNEKYKVLDLNGKCVDSGLINSKNSIDIQNLDNGIYFIELQNKKFKFIKI